MQTSSLLALLLCPLPIIDVEMPAIFGDGMVLQRNAPVAIWGRADPGEEVSIHIDEETQTTQAGKDGEWLVQLAPRPVGPPLTLTVKGKTELVFDDVLFGEVWIGAGQSNMGLPVRCCRPTESDLANRPELRLYQQSSYHSTEPQWKGDGSWSAASKETVTEFSGALFYFGLDLQRALGVPVGLIQVSLGGTRIESWTSAEAQYSHELLAPYAKADDSDFRAFDMASEFKKYKLRAAAWDRKHPNPTAKELKQGRPRGSFEMHMRVGNVAGLFNGKIAPLIPYTIQGVVWYQGENNAKRPDLYQHQLPNLIRDWRKQWGQGNFPFAWVQLPNFAVPEEGELWPEMRDVQRRALSEPNTGMAIALDIGQARNIHPWNKQLVGRRLAYWALGTAYGMEVPTSGPLYASHEVKESSIAIRFAHTYGQLRQVGPSLDGFELSGEDGIWYPAEAALEGDSVTVRSASVPAPLRVRYNWSNNPHCTLIGACNIPASPFTTDGPPRVQ